MSKKSVVETFNPETGEPEQFRAFSSRLQEFLSEFKPQDGYRMVVTASDSLSSMPGLASLYRTAIEAGKNPVDVGLPDLTRFSRQMVFRAELLDGNGQIVSSASSFCEIERPDKTWEVMETNARSRLMASLGVGYELLDADEARQLGQQKQQQPKPRHSTAPTFNPVEDQQSDLENEDVETISTPQEEVVAEQTSGDSDELFEPAAAPQKSPVEPVVTENIAGTEQLNDVLEFPFAANAKEKISEAVLRQIRTMSINKNEKVQSISTNSEARAERKRLMTA